MWKQMMPAFRMTLLLTILTGLIYPAVVTGICQVLFPERANGSMVVRDGKVVGSELIGQTFAKPEYFPSRPSASDYDAMASGGSNLGPTSKKLMDRVQASAAKLRTENPAFTGSLPADSVTASASGLDPHVSPEFAKLNAGRVAQARGVAPAELVRLIDSLTEGRDLGSLGEPRVNVLRLNLALDDKFPVRR